MKSWLDYFKEICNVPRESGNENGIREYLLSFAKENDIEGLKDKDGNIVLRTKASKGFENNPVIILQAHMDMVCVKKEDSKHDFTKDPIEIVINGDKISAKDTSLGGDNGVAIAMILAFMSDKTSNHGIVEALITYSEETGFYGAKSVDPSFLSGKKLLNLDSEEENTFIIGCAGGMCLFLKKKVSFTTILDNYKCIKVAVTGLPGGHSGSEIHLNRPNAIKVLANKVSSLQNYQIVSFDGGARDNVIPSGAQCILAIPNNCMPAFEYQEVQKYSKALNKTDSKQIIESLKDADHGVYAWSKEIKDVVETSDNLAIAKLKENAFEVTVNIRSLVEEEKAKLCNKICAHFKNFGYCFATDGGYPTWQPNVNSDFLNQCLKVWKNVSGKDAVVTSIHAGLECGIIASKIKGLDCVSMGPDIYDVHSVNENFSINSTDRIYSFIKALVADKLS